MKLNAIAVGMVIALASPSFGTHAQAIENDASPTSTTTIQRFSFSPGSLGAQGVLAWRAQQQSEAAAPVPNAAQSTLDNIDLGIVTVEIISKMDKAAISAIPSGAQLATAIAGGVALPSARMPGEIITTTAAGGVTLPPTGTPGEVITITSCIAGSSTITETYKWVPGPNGGGTWVKTNTEIKANASIACSTA